MQNPNGAIKIFCEVAPIVTCREFADFMADYLDGRAARRGAIGVRAPSEALPELPASTSPDYAETVKLGKRAFDNDDAAVPADVPEELVKAILDARTAD